MLAALQPLSPGHAVLTRENITGVDEPFTFVIDLDGTLRLAPRRSEHVACPRCEERNLVRGGDFTCAICDTALPTTWNFTSTVRNTRHQTHPPRTSSSALAAGNFPRDLAAVQNGRDIACNAWSTGHGELPISLARPQKPLLHAERMLARRLHAAHPSHASQQDVSSPRSSSLQERINSSAGTRYSCLQGYDPNMSDTKLGSLSP